MERKIGEIFEYNGEWYQCINPEIYGCSYCDLENKCVDDIKGKVAACHAIYRSDKKCVVFKKLEKVGEPFERNGYMYQEYKAHTYPLLMNGGVKLPTANGFAIKIKQNKEDMEEKKVRLKKEDIDFLYNKFIEIVEDCVVKGYNIDNVQHEFGKLFLTIKDSDTKLNLKPFDLEAAKAGKPVCTRDGRKARIICFDAKDNLPIIALITNARGDESLARYKSNGRFTNTNESDCDLMMLLEKKEGWVNLYKSSARSTKEEAMKYRNKCNDYIDTIKISWEEQL